jgi:hypothetical protein
VPYNGPTYYPKKLGIISSASHRSGGLGEPKTAKNLGIIPVLRQKLVKTSKISLKTLLYIRANTQKNKGYYVTSKKVLFKKFLTFDMSPLEGSMQT